METAVYCRVSTEEQAQEGFSIRAQEQKLKEFANVKDWSIYNIYIDEGISGKNITERPAITRLIEDIKAGHIKNVLVFKLDRLTRSVADLVYLIDLFKAHQCDFNSLMESIDTGTASGRMFIKIIGIFAEFERENISERVRIGKERKTREGYTNNSRHRSYGYDRPIGERIQTINDYEAENVRKVFDMYVNQGMSLSAVSRSFNMQKIPTKQGSIWCSATVKAILTNCNYIGYVRYCMHDPTRNFETKGKHEAIISEELYNKAQILIEKNAKVAPTKKPDQRNYFVNFLYCDVCGYKFKPLNTVYYTKSGDKRKSHVFRCNTKSLKGECNSKSVTAGKIEKALIEYFSQYEDVFESDSEEAARLEQERVNSDAQVKIYKDKLRHLDNREKEVMSHYIAGDIDFDSYRGMKKQLDSDRAFAKSELEKLIKNEGKAHPTTIFQEEVIASFRENWQKLTNEEKRMFLTKYIKKIVIRNDPIEGSAFGDTKITNVEFNTH